MLKKIKYSNAEDREIVIHNNSTLFIVEQQNLLNGNYLVFSDAPALEGAVYTDVLESDR